MKLSAKEIKRVKDEIAKQVGNRDFEIREVERSYNVFNQPRYTVWICQYGSPFLSEVKIEAK